MTVVRIERVVDIDPGASDSRPCMKRIAKLLGLDAEATEEQIVEALEEVRVDAKDKTRERWEKLYKADADADDRGARGSAASTEPPV